MIHCLLVALVPAVVGELVINAIKDKKTVTLTLPSGSTVAGVYDQVYHGTPAYYSSWGPGYDLSSKSSWQHTNSQH